MLGPFILTLHYDSGGQMSETNRARRFIDMLAAGAARPIRVDPKLTFVNDNVELFFYFGYHINGRKRSVTPFIGIER